MPDLISPDDLPQETATELDVELKRQLEMSVSRHFFESCDGFTQALLIECEWSICVAEALILVIYCSDQRKNWRILNRMVIFAERLSQFSSQARIRVYPPSETEDLFEMRVDERSVYRGTL